MNHGRRPRTIEKVGFTYREPAHSQHVIASDSFFKGPQELTEGRSAEWLVEQGKFTPDDIEDVWAFDQTGKRFSGRAKKRR